MIQQAFFLRIKRGARQHGTIINSIYASYVEKYMLFKFENHTENNTIEITPEAINIFNQFIFKDKNKNEFINESNDYSNSLSDTPEEELDGDNNERDIMLASQKKEYIYILSKILSVLIANKSIASIDSVLHKLYIKMFNELSEKKSLIEKIESELEDLQIDEEQLSKQYISACFDTSSDSSLRQVSISEEHEKNKTLQKLTEQKIPFIEGEYECFKVQMLTKFMDTILIRAGDHGKHKGQLNAEDKWVLFYEYLDEKINSDPVDIFSLLTPAFNYAKAQSAIYKINYKILQILENMDMSAIIKFLFAEGERQNIYIPNLYKTKNRLYNEISKILEQHKNPFIAFKNLIDFLDNKINDNTSESYINYLIEYIDKFLLQELHASIILKYDENKKCTTSEFSPDFSSVFGEDIDLKFLKPIDTVIMPEAIFIKHDENYTSTTCYPDISSSNILASSLANLSSEDNEFTIENVDNEDTDDHEKLNNFMRNNDLNLPSLGQLRDYKNLYLSKGQKEITSIYIISTNNIFYRLYESIENHNLEFIKIAYPFLTNNVPINGLDHSSDLLSYACKMERTNKEIINYIMHIVSEFNRFHVRHFYLLADLCNKADPNFSFIKELFITINPWEKDKEGAFLLSLNQIIDAELWYRKNNLFPTQHINGRVAFMILFTLKYANSSLKDKILMGKITNLGDKTLIRFYETIQKTEDEDRELLIRSMFNYLVSHYKILPSKDQRDTGIKCLKLFKPKIPKPIQTKILNYLDPSQEVIWDVLFDKLMGDHLIIQRAVDYAIEQNNLQTRIFTLNF